jgi:hypothetical protein
LQNTGLENSKRIVEEFEKGDEMMGREGGSERKEGGRCLIVWQ